jgi:hypothetical protein
VQAAPPGRAEIASDVLYNGSVIGEVTHVLEHDGKAYRLTERTKGRGVFALLGEAQRTSRGTIAPDGLRPLEYEDVRTGRKPASARFAWDAKSVTLQFREGRTCDPRRRTRRTA